MSTQTDKPKPVGRAGTRARSKHLPAGYKRYFVAMQEKLWKAISIRGIEEDRSPSDILDQAARLYLETVIPDRTDDD